MGQSNCRAILHGFPRRRSACSAASRHVHRLRPHIVQVVATRGQHTSMFRVLLGGDERLEKPFVPIV